MPPGIGLAAVRAVHPADEVEPELELRQEGEPRRRRVVHLACGDAASPSRDARHLAQHRHGIVHVLQGLMGVDDVVGVVVELQRVGVAPHEFGGRVELGRRGERVGRGIHADHPARREPLGELGGDGSGAATDIEQRATGQQVGFEVVRGVRDRAPAVRGEDARVVTMRVLLRLGHQIFLSRTVETVWSRSLRRTSDARARVGRMFSTRLGSLISRQISRALAMASS